MELEPYLAVVEFIDFFSLSYKLEILRKMTSLVTLIKVFNFFPPPNYKTHPISKSKIKLIKVTLTFKLHYFFFISLFVEDQEEFVLVPTI